MAERTVVRSDVMRNRRSILDAARELFSLGSDVPLYEVARHAGVGQATLYRHFPDRQSLVITLGAELVGELEALACATAGPPGFYALLDGVVRIGARSGGLIAVLHDSVASVDELRCLKARVAGIFDAPLASAQRAGIVRDDLTVDDVLLAINMVHGIVIDAEPDLEQRSALAHRALGLLIDGMRASDATR